MKAYTVETLHKELGALIQAGLGARLVLVPDYTEEIDGDYRTIGQIDATQDISNTCVYLEFNEDAEEKEFWENQ